MILLIWRFRILKCNHLKLNCFLSSRIRSQSSSFISSRKSSRSLSKESRFWKLTISSSMRKCLPAKILGSLFSFKATSPVEVNAFCNYLCSFSIEITSPIIKFYKNHPKTRLFLTSLLGTHKIVPILTLPLVILQPITIGFFLLN